MKFKVEGMTCNGCARAVEQALAEVPGVVKVKVNYVKKEAAVQGEAAFEELARAVEAAGYRLAPKAAV